MSGAPPPAHAGWATAPPAYWGQQPYMPQPQPAWGPPPPPQHQPWALPPPPALDPSGLPMPMMTPQPQLPPSPMQSPMQSPQPSPYQPPPAPPAPPPAPPPQPAQEQPAAAQVDLGIITALHEQIKGDAKAMLRKRLQKTTSGGPVQEKEKGQGQKGGAGKGAPAASLHDSLKNVRALAEALLLSERLFCFSCKC